MAMLPAMGVPTAMAMLTAMLTALLTALLTAMG